MTEVRKLYFRAMLGPGFLNRHPRSLGKLFEWKQWHRWRHLQRLQVSPLVGEIS
jgi:hypothetical protein